MPLNFILPLISFLLLYQSSAVSTDNQPKPYEDAEAYEVYGAILPTEGPWQVAKAKSLVIRSETKGYKMCLSPDEESEKIIGQAISQYVKLNEKNWLLKRGLSIEKSYELVPYDELKSALKQGGWENFYKQYPNSGGWIELSAIGFNADKTVAVVYMGHHSWSLSGGGGFHVLQKKDGKWVPLKWKGSSCGWES
jgi:hypothetical protein